MKVKKEDPTTTEHMEASEDDHSALTPLAHDIQTDFSVEPCPTATPFMSRSKTFDSFDHRKQQRNQASSIFIHNFNGKMKLLLLFLLIVSSISSISMEVILFSFLDPTTRLVL